MDTVELLTGVSLDALLAQLDDLVLGLEAADCVAEHPLRMTQPPRMESATTAFASRIEWELRQVPPTALRDCPASALGDSG